MSSNQEEILLSYLVMEHDDEHFTILPVVEEIIKTHFPEGEALNIPQLAASISNCAAEIQLHIENLNHNLDPEYISPKIQEIVAASLGMTRIWKLINRFQEPNLASLI